MQDGVQAKILTYCGIVILCVALDNNKIKSNVVLPFNSMSSCSLKPPHFNGSNHLRKLKNGYDKVVSGAKPAASAASLTKSENIRQYHTTYFPTTKLTPQEHEIFYRHSKSCTN